MLYVNGVGAISSMQIKVNELIYFEFCGFYVEIGIIVIECDVFWGFIEKKSLLPS